jgi:hypothetical protein
MRTRPQEGLNRLGLCLALLTTEAVGFGLIAQGVATRGAGIREAKAIVATAVRDKVQDAVADVIGIYRYATDEIASANSVYRYPETFASIVVNVYFDGKLSGTFWQSTLDANLAKPNNEVNLGVTETQAGLGLAAAGVGATYFVYALTRPYGLKKQRRPA